MLSRVCGCCFSGAFRDLLFGLRSPPAVDEVEPGHPDIDSSFSDSPVLSDAEDPSAAEEVHSRASTEPEVVWWERVVPAEPGEDLLLLGDSLPVAGGWTGRQRVALAYHRGLESQRIVRGEQRYFGGDRVRTRNTIYVVLRADEHADPFYTSNYATYVGAVKTGHNGTFSRFSVSHAFGSEIEATSFCLGAGLPALPRRL